MEDGVLGFWSALSEIYPEPWSQRCWVHIRTTNPIESTFATIRHRTDRTKGCVSRNTMLAMIYKLGMSAEQRWRRTRGFNSLAKVIEGVKFRDGVEVNSDTADSRSAA